MRIVLVFIFFTFMFTGLHVTCKKEHAANRFLSRKCVIVIVDGPRWTETGGDNTHAYTPYLYSNLKPLGTLFNAFYNNGETQTTAGHTAILTGFYQSIANNGTETPQYPSLLQLFKEKYPNAKTQLTTSKDKLEVLRNCMEISYSNKYIPNNDCGVAGLSTGYRADSVTFEHAKKQLQQEHPDFMFIQFKEPDASGHANNWAGYLDGIKSGDAYAWEIWNILQNDAFYKDQTLFVITNDHGRHLDGLLDGFVSHGDGCDGCRHINLFMAGPDIALNKEITTNYDQTDLHKTICAIFGLNAAFSKGNIMSEVFNK